MTLKTTKEQRDALLIDIDDPDFAVYNSVARDLCHDAGRAEELEMLYEQRGLYLQDAEATIADLRAKLDRFERIAEHGKGYGDDLDNIERLGELEKEIADLKGWIKHYERGEPEAWKALRQEVADLRAKLNGAYDRAAEELEKAFNGADTLNLLRGALRALKEQEKSG